VAYRVTKTYGHEQGLSACFRQPRALSHCRFLHGYALSFKFVFEADTLDENNWVIDFGSLKPLKSWLCSTFDHKLLVAEDDPDRQTLEALGQHTENFKPLADVLVVPGVGCEAFARMAWDWAELLLYALGSEVRTEGVPVVGGVMETTVTGKLNERVRLVEVEVREHGSNGATYTGEDK